MIGKSRTLQSALSFAKTATLNALKLKRRWRNIFLQGQNLQPEVLDGFNMHQR